MLSWISVHRYAYYRGHPCTGIHALLDICAQVYMLRWTSMHRYTRSHGPPRLGMHDVSWTSTHRYTCSHTCFHEPSCASIHAVMDLRTRGYTCCRGTPCSGKHNVWTSMNRYSYMTPQGPPCTGLHSLMDFHEHVYTKSHGSP